MRRYQVNKIFNFPVPVSTRLPGLSGSVLVPTTYQLVTLGTFKVIYDIQNWSKIFLFLAENAVQLTYFLKLVDYSWIILANPWARTISHACIFIDTQWKLVGKSLVISIIFLHLHVQLNETNMQQIGGNTRLRTLQRIKILGRHFF